jgi:L-threonylcarbamoyladenylate synthase
MAGFAHEAKDRKRQFTRILVIHVTEIPMQTLFRALDPLSPEPSIIAEAAACLLRGGLVAFPTETVYGLGANALDAEAVQRIFLAKGRPASDPLIVHVAAPEDVTLVAAEVPALAQQLISAFWPGPLTLLLPRRADLPDEVTAGMSKVAVRMPAHPVAQALRRAAGVPIAAPSANRFAHVSPTNAAHVRDDLSGRIEMILDAGPTSMGVESTVLDPTQTPAVILRLGSLPRAAFESRNIAVRVAGADENISASPGRMPRHYAPDAHLMLIQQTVPTTILYQFQVSTAMLEEGGHKVGWLAADEVVTMVATRNGTFTIWNLGSIKDTQTIARRLFAGIRTLESEGVDYILAHRIPSDGLGEAINDRLTRASFHTEGEIP